MRFYPISEFIYRMFCNNISKFKPQFQSLSHGGTKSAEVYGVSRFTAHRNPLVRGETEDSCTTSYLG